MEREIDLRELALLLWRKIWLIAAVGIVCFVAGFLWTKMFIPKKYSSHIQIYAQSTFSEDNDNQLNDISKSKQLINTYIEVLKDDAVMLSVGNELVKQFGTARMRECFAMEGDRIKESSLKSCLSISSVTDTNAIRIVATTKDAEVSAAVCTELSKQANGFIERAIKLGGIRYIDDYQVKVNNTPVSPNVKKRAVLAGLAGAFLVALIVIVIDLLDNTVKSTEMLSEKFKKPILGEIQNIDEVQKRKKKYRDLESDQRRTLLDKDIPFYVVESCKSLRTNVNFALSTNDKKVLAVSSANPSEGKSTTAANLAITMAESGKKVLLIDADLRKNVQNRIFHVKNEKGLSSVISRMHPVEECIQATTTDNLHIMTSGPLPPNPSELLASRQAIELFDFLSEIYDLVIIDSPPINVATDILTLGDRIAGILLVFRYGMTSEDEASEAVKRVELANMNLVGFVLNGIDVKSSSGYYSKYSKYSSYGQEEESGEGSNGASVNRNLPRQQVRRKDDRSTHSRAARD
ncbi:MAG: polysaccharide biosynthesis tyrosine autokinase [Lachnospiraceae bacterium]|nr:polysaccharide biosynthesis tyrosine autokinase [Lachnospiraceae bacterium]